MSKVPNEYVDRWEKTNAAKSVMEKSMLDVLRAKDVSPETVNELRTSYAEICEAYVKTKEWLMQKFPNEGDLHLPWNVRG